MSDEVTLEYEPGVLWVLQTKSETKAFYDKIAKVSRGDCEGFETGVLTRHFGVNHESIGPLRRFSGIRPGFALQPLQPPSLLVDPDDLGVSRYPHLFRHPRRALEGVGVGGTGQGLEG
jgi:hypothetical protein